MDNIEQYVVEPMDSIVKDRWIKALRSGEYKQTRGALRKSNGEPSYCCLGVLCNIYLSDGNNVTWGQDDEFYYPEGGGSSAYKRIRGILPSVVMQWAGLNDSKAQFRGGEAYTDSTLAGVNDNGKSFEEIANIIEEKF